MSTYCERCERWIPDKVLDTPNHCLDTRCTTMDYDARMARAKQLGRDADYFSALDAAAFERLARRMGAA